MMAKKKESPKLDATVKFSGTGFKFPAPPYKKRWQDFHKHFREGEVATIHRRHWIQKTQEWTTVEMEVLLLERAINCFYYEDEDGNRKGCPWWAIHDFEIEGYPPSEADGDDQLEGE
jgi:hypothetical protein